MLVVYFEIVKLMLVGKRYGLLLCCITCSSVLMYVHSVVLTYGRVQKKLI